MAHRHIPKMAMRRIGGTPKPPSRKLRSVRFLVLVIGVCCVASAAILARYGLQAGESPTSLSAWRLVAASLGLIAFQCVRRPSRKVEGADRIRCIGAGVALALHFATWIASLQLISVVQV